MNKIPQDRSSELVQLMMKYQRKLFGYILTLVPSRSDAEDILQETSLTICEKFADFETGTNFYSWACQIAYWKVRAARKKFATSKVIFNEEVLGQIIKLEKEGGETVHTIDLAQTILCTPAVSDNSVFIRSDKNLWRLSAR